VEQIRYINPQSSLLLVAKHQTETTAFIYLENPEDYSLYPNRDVILGTQNIYMISAHHQLHCLKKLHIAMTLLAHPPDNSTTEELLGGVKHAEHCFNYLRQGILCAADSALEGPTPENDLLGYDVQHQCRKWDGEGGLDEWRRKHDANNMR
jgi:hypothetical protein